MRGDGHAGAVVEFRRADDRRSRNVLGRALRVVVHRVHRAERDVTAAAECVELGKLLDGAMGRNTENAAGVCDQHIHARGLDGVVLAMTWYEVVILLKHHVQLLPGLENLERAVEAGIYAGPRKIVAQDRLESRVAGDAEIGGADTEYLVVIDDVLGRFPAGALFGHGVRGDGRIAAFSYHRYGSHQEILGARTGRRSTIFQRRSADNA